MVTQAYTISTVRNAVPPKVKMSQYDYGLRTINFSVVDGSGSAIDLSSYDVTVEGTRIDGHAFATACAISGNVATFTDTVDMTNAAGDHSAELVIRDGDDRLGTMNFVISVEPAAMDEDAELSPEDRAIFDQLYEKLASGSPLVVTMAAEMTDTSAAYLYTGSEIGYTAGDWYYYNGSAWVSGGTYGAAALDNELSESSMNAVQNRVITRAINSLIDGKKYGVSGIGSSASALTRLWDAVGMVAQVGTDGDNSNVVNDFDNIPPWTRRKCVGKWYLIDGKTVFRPRAYYGDSDYAEDGTMGDYVAVECPIAYYYLKDGVLGISDRQLPGYRPFDIFCIDHDPQRTIPYAYLPAYALALKDGRAVSLPGLDNLQGCYKDIIDACRTYGGDAGAYAFSQPWAVNFYEWALFTVEFATQNCQSIMYGCATLRHSADDRATLRNDGKWLLSNYQAARVVGEYVSIQLTTVDINAVVYYASHRITSITRCDAEGNANSSGAYQLVETEDLGLGRSYTVGESYRFAARPWRTGECNDVSTPSGSPVSNTNGYYPMRYRWRENVYANQYKTIGDLFNKLVADGNSYMLEWYYLTDPAHYSPSTASKPDTTDLATDAFTLLDVSTDSTHYNNGYIQSKQYSEEFPDVWIPLETTGANGSSYYCDYAYLVNSYAVRAVRSGGTWHNGASDGFSYLNGYYAPSHASAHYGGDLFFPQGGGGELTAA